MLLWITAAVALFLWRVCKGRKKMPWPIPPVLLFIGVSSLVWAPIPWFDTTLASMAGTVLSKVLGLIPGLPVGVAAAVAILALLIAAVFDLSDKHPDGWAKTAILVVPFLAVIGTGPIPTAVQQFTNTVSGHSTDVVSTIADG